MADKPKIICGRYTLDRQLGGDHDANVHLGTDVRTGERVAIKLESCRTRSPSLLYESKLYKILQGGVGVAKVHWYGVEGEYSVMVMDLLGPSLEDLFKLCNRRFSLKTVLMLAVQLISRLEFLHKRSFIHRGSTKPDNFVMGLGEKVNQVYIIDFELSKKYRDPKSLVHIPYRDHKEFIGNPIFASINAHEGIDATRRDDLESLGYMLVYFLKGSLPWQFIPAYRVSANSRHGKRRQQQAFMYEKKVDHIEQLTQDCPMEFTTYFKYVRALRYDEQPDYNYLRRLFRDLFDREGYVWDHEFDWYVLRRQWHEYTNQLLEGVKEPQQQQEEGNATEPQHSQPPQPQQQQKESGQQSQEPHQGQGAEAAESEATLSHFPFVHVFDAVFSNICVARIIHARTTPCILTT